MDALILVDLQNDFMPGGALAVPEGDQVVPVANRFMPHVDFVVATADWHPAEHCSFASNHPGHHVGDLIQVGGLDQRLWPVHCVQDTPGAELHSDLDRSRIQHVIRKGCDPLLDSYSGFFDNGHVQSTGLDEYLKSRRVTRVFILGLATDYCVKWTALDALQLGYETTLIQDGCRAVNLEPRDGQRAFAELTQAGATILQSDHLP